jgi:twinkle protein
MANFLRHGGCPKCKSSDALAIYDDGGSHCFGSGCSYHTNGDEMVVQEQTQAHAQAKRLNMGGTVAAIPDRRISQETCRHFGVTVEYSATGEVLKHFYPYYKLNTNEVSAAKVREVKDKNFYSSGNTVGVGFFGQTKCTTNKYITITEGELDALSIYEMSGRKWDVVSLRTGASGAAKEIKEQLEWLESYETVVICFDNDKAGEEAVDQIKDLFSPNKLHICRLPLKDASEMLMANKVKDFIEWWWNAKTYRPDGIVAGVDTWDNLVEKRNVRSIPYPWEGLNVLTRGHRPYELVTITSGSGMGKSQFIRELEYDLLKRCEGNIGVLALEEDLSRTTLGIMSIAANRPLHLEENTSVSDLRPFWEATLGTGRYYLFDHCGSTSADNLLARVRFMAKALDCKFIVLDHLSIIVSSQESGDERKAIDEIMTKLRTLVAETGICLFLVSHLKRSSGQAHEDGGRISLSELRGSQAIAQLSDIVIGMERDQQNENPELRNTTTVRVLKNRYTGETGPACWLFYDKSTGRLSEVSNPEKGDDF